MSFRRHAWCDLGVNVTSPSEALQGKYKHFIDLRRYKAVLPFRYESLERYEGGWEGDYNEPPVHKRHDADWRNKFVKQPAGEAGA